MSWGTRWLDNFINIKLAKIVSKHEHKCQFRSRCFELNVRRGRIVNQRGSFGTCRHRQQSYDISKAGCHRQEPDKGRSSDGLVGSHNLHITQIQMAPKTRTSRKQTRTSADSSLTFCEETKEDNAEVKE